MVSLVAGPRQGIAGEELDQKPALVAAQLGERLAAVGAGLGGERLCQVAELRVAVKPILHRTPDAAELDYCLAGKAQFSLGFPDNEWERFELTAGQIGIIPQGWFHSIQNVGEDVLSLLVIFNNSAPNDIGISEGFQAIPPEVLAITFNMSPDLIKQLDKNVAYIAPQ